MQIDTEFREHSTTIKINFGNKQKLTRGDLKEIKDLVATYLVKIKQDDIDYCMQYEAEEGGRHFV